MYTFLVPLCSVVASVLAVECLIGKDRRKLPRGACAGDEVSQGMVAWDRRFAWDELAGASGVRRLRYEAGMSGNVVGSSYGDLLVTSLVVLGGICVAAFMVVRLAGRFLATGRSRGTHLLDVVARLALEPKRSLYVVEVAGKTLLVGTSEMGLSLLAELDGGEVRARVVERPNFGELVRSAWQRRRGANPDEALDHHRVDQATPHRDPERRVEQHAGEAVLDHGRRVGEVGEVGEVQPVGGGQPLGGAHEAHGAR
jgi:flagellar protein FliO/FliZ